MSTYVDNIDPAECCLKCSADPLCTFWIHTDYNKLDNYITADDSSITNAIENANSGPNHPGKYRILLLCVYIHIYI